jgi:hypothetical protein
MTSFFRNAGRATTAALLIVSAAACDSASSISAPEGAAALNVASTTVDVDIQAAALQWLIDNKSATGLDAQCVSVGYPEADLDPGADLLSRFAGRTPPVVAFSSCTISIGGDTYNPTGGPAEWFFLGTPTISGKQAEIPAGFHLNGRLTERFLCTVRQQGAAWTVRNCTLTGAA